jgi:hemin uptake protein HemP
VTASGSSAKRRRKIAIRTVLLALRKKCAKSEKALTWNFCQTTMRKILVCNGVATMPSLDLSPSPFGTRAADAFSGAAGQAENRGAPVLDTRALFPDGRRQVDILHGGQRYSLRLTRENKLILTK